MKILIVSWYFPPCSTMGALRVGKFAKFLVGQGHDVRVVCARDQPYAMDHPVEVPEDIIFYTRWRDINWLPARVQSLRVWLGNLRSGGRHAAANADGDSPSATPSAPSNASGPAGDATRKRSIFQRALSLYRLLTNIPDGVIGWLLPALSAGKIATKGWKPDVVFASAPPFTTLIAGRMIARRAGAPLVIEYRDRWIEDPYGAEVPKLRQWIDRKLENWTARPARAVVTVSDPWADDYRARWGKPVTVCYNGYDPDDMAAVEKVEPRAGDTLNILYTGIIYPERRDPTPLFDALSLMGDERRNFSVDFYGPNVDQLAEAVDRAGHADIVNLRPSVPFKDALKLQRQADILLLLQWNNPLEAGNVPGKLFEYIAARRPVLGIGYEDGVPARILRERDAGLVANDPARIAEFLRRYHREKISGGTLALTDAKCTAGLSRTEQFARVEAGFLDLVST